MEIGNGNGKKNTPITGHMEKQEMEMKWKLEMEIGNGNWKRKWEEKHTNHWCNVSFIVWLDITLAFYVAMVIWLALWVMCFPLLLYCALSFFWVVLMWQAMLQSSLVHMWEGSGHKTSCNLTTRVTYFILQQGLHSYSCSLVPRPTSSFDCLQCVKQIMASYPGPGYNSPIHCPPPPPDNTYQCRNTGVLMQTLILAHVQGTLIQNQLDTKTWEWFTPWE